MNDNWEIVEHFEQLIADHTGAKYGVAVDSCTNAIFLSLKRLNSEGLVIDVPKRTYVGVAAAVINAGCHINFTDNEWTGQYQLSPVPVVDCACCFGKNMYIEGNLCCLSFHYKKPLAIDRGGMILTDNEDHYKWLKAARYAGRETKMYNDIQDIKIAGYHMYMTPSQAAIGIQTFHAIKHKNYVSGRHSDYKHDLSKFTAFQ